MAAQSGLFAPQVFAEPGAETTSESDNGAPPAAPDTSEVAPPPPPRKPPLRLDIQKGESVAKEIAANKSENTEIHWFREGQESRFLGLFTPEHGEKPQGYALILHDNQQHPDWPGLIRTLRLQLPAGGWSTLSISLPDQWHIPTPPPRTDEEYIVAPANNEGATSAPETEVSEEDTPANEAESEAPVNEMAAASAELPSPSENQEMGNETAEEVTASEPDSAGPRPSFTQLSVEYPVDETPSIFKQRVQEALDYLKAKDPMPIIIVSIGSSATMMAKQAHELRMKDIAGLVVIDPATIKLTTSNDFDPDGDAPGLRIPVLDISPQFNPRSNPKQRKQNAKRQTRKTYEQHTISGANEDFKGHEDQIVKRIRGWSDRVIINKSRFGYL